MAESQVLDRLQHYARDWNVVVEKILETPSSLVAYGSHRDQSVVLKVIRQPLDEWRSGEILEAFAGNGVVPVLRWVPGAVLMERLRPGNSLVDLALNGRDEQATDILANVIQKMSGHESAGLELRHDCPTVQDWGKGFANQLATGGDQIPSDLLQTAQRIYSHLCVTQRQPKLLHGDLQHYNVLFDSNQGWLAIDPKGVIGELEFEIGVVLRNPIERAELFLSRATIEKRLQQFTSKLNLDFRRALAWGFAQAVLSAIWEIEDGFEVDATNRALRLAKAIRPMLTE